MQPSVDPTRRARMFAGQPIRLANQPTQFDKEAALILQQDPRFYKSLALETRFRASYDPDILEQMQNSKAYAQRVRNDMLQEKDIFKMQYRAQFLAITENEKENFDFKNGYQWKAEEQKLINALSLNAHVSNYMGRWIKNLMGEQRGAKTEYNNVNNDPSFKIAADFWNQVMGTITRQNKWSLKEAQVFEDLAVGGRGFSSVRADPFDPQGKLLLQHHDPPEFMYDIDMADNGHLDGCHNLLRARLEDVEDLIWQYPLWEKELRDFDYADFSYQNLFLFMVRQPKVHPTSGKLVLPQKYRHYGHLRGRRIAWVEEFYRRGGKEMFSVRDGNDGTDHDFDNIEQSVDFYRNLREAHRSMAIAQTGQEGVDMVYPPRRVTRSVVDQEVWCGNILVDVQSAYTDRFPYECCHNDFHRGEFRGFFEDDKPHQKLRNRMLILYELAVSGIKGKTVVNKRAFPKGTTTGEIEEWLVRPTKPLIVDTALDIEPSKIIHHIDSPGIGPGVAQIMEFVKEASSFVNGGVNQIGEAEFAGQSARLGRQLNSVAATGTVPLFDDFTEFGVRVGEDIRYQAQFLQPQALLEMCDPRDRPSFVPVIQSGVHTIAAQQMGMELLEVLAGPSKREREIGLIQDMVHNDPTLAQDVAPELLELSGMAQSRIDRIQARTAARLQAEQDQQDHENKMAEWEMEMKWGLASEDRDIKREQNDIARNPPINVSASLKLPEVGPLTTASIMEQSRLPADPTVVAQDQAIQKLINQDERNMMQEQYNKRVPPWQRKPSGHQGKSPGVSTPKDASARASKGSEKTN